jgi:uroporphyrin-3 C-methyltransferase
VLLLIVLCLASMGLAWNTQQRVHTLEQELVRRQQASQDQANEARLVAQQAGDAAREQAAKLALIEERVAQSALQRTQVDDLIQSLSRSRDDNVQADVEASVRVAMQQAEITGSAEPLAAALKQADDRLSHDSQPRLERLHRAVVRDLDRVRSVAGVDVPALAAKLDDAARSIDDLPLISTAERPLKGGDTLEARDAERPGGAAAHARAVPAKGRAATREPAASDGPADAASATDGESPGWAGALTLRASQLWQSLGVGLWNEVRSLVRVTRIDRPEAMLIAPDQSFFLRENLKLRLLNARLALLSRQFDQTQADVRQAQQALARYFDPASHRVMATQELLRQVASQSQKVSIPRPDDTLTALAALSASR